jgi:pyruvate,water dikinase
MAADQRKNPTIPLVAPIFHFDRGDLELAGGKGANLGELLRAGFHVPPGYIITTAAYDLLLQSNGLHAHLKQMIGSLDQDNQADNAKASQTIQNLFQQSPIPEQIMNETLNAYRELDGAVAVRSSATAEDLPEAAFAGQQETFLNVLDEQALLDAVRACWASLWSERAVLYRIRQRVDHSTVKLAVVVQKMVPADVAGVLFTANPVSGARDELIIDASPGLGEAVVGGMVTPDHFIVDKHSGRIKEQRLGRREIIVRPRAGGGTEPISSIQDPTDPALPSEAIGRLSNLGIDIERHYGSPQDIEWAWVKDQTKTGQFFILQARPMTALPEPIKVSGSMKLVLPMLAEMWPTRPYPLDITTFTGAVERAIGSLLVTMIGKSAPNPDEMLLEEDGIILQFKLPQFHPRPSMLLIPWITMWRTRHYDPTRWEADPALTELLEDAGTLEQRDLKAPTWQQHIETIHESLALVPRVMELREHYFPQALLGLIVLRLLLALAGRSNRFGTLVSAVRTKTMETNQALEELAVQIRTDPRLRDLFDRIEARDLQAELETRPVGQAFLERFHAFLDEYGHRETGLTISQAAWKDQPEVVLGILKVLAQTELKRSNRSESWQQTRDELLDHSVLGTQPLRKLFLTSLARARAFFQIREDTHFYATLSQPTIRRVALELGRRLVQTGALVNVADVFHLRLDELEGFGEPWPPADQTIAKIQALIADRKARRQSLENKPMFDPRLLSITARAQPEEGILLQGTSASPGVARGPARIVHDVSEFGKLKTGDVLVAPVTNPAWTPLFQRAVAVVVDTGGAASHAAIVAREYGIPAVMATIKGTKELADGQWIQVDGAGGLVLKAEEHQ